MRTFDPTHELWEPMNKPGLRRFPTYGVMALGQMAGGTPGQRLVLLMMYELAEIELFTGDGYNGTTAADLVLWTGLAEGTIAEHLAALSEGGLLTRRWRTVRRRAREWVYRIPDDADRFVNGQAPA